MEELLNESLILDGALQAIEDDSLREKRIKMFLNEHKGVEVEKSLLSSSELEWFNKSSEHLAGKVIILDFFTYCCINCVHAMPILQSLEVKYSKENVLLIGVHSAKFSNEKSSANIQHALSRHGIARPVVNDHSYNLWNAFGITCWPSILIIDQSFKLRKYFVGENFLKGVDKFVNTLLGTPLQHDSPALLMNPSSTPYLKGLYYPGKISAYKGKIALSDSGNNRILLLQSSKEPLIIGDGCRGLKNGPLAGARFNSPQGLVMYDEDTIFVADTGNNLLRKVCLKEATVSTILGNGEQGQDFIGGHCNEGQPISSPWDLCVGPDPKGCGEALYIAMAGLHQIWAYGITDTEWWKGIRREAGSGFAVAGNGREENRNNSYPHQASFAQPSGICYSGEEYAIFIADSESSSVRRLNLKDGSVRNVCGGERDPTNLFAFGDVDGPGVKARLQHPLSVALFSEGRLLVADSYNHKLKVIENLGSKSPSCTTFEPSVFSNLQEPSDVAYVRDEDSLYICDSNNHQILTYNLSTKVVRPLTLPPLPQQGKSLSRRKEENISLKITPSSPSFEIHFVCGNESKEIVDGKLLESVAFVSYSTRLESKKFVVGCECKDSSGRVNVKLQVIACNEEERACKMSVRNYLIDYSIASLNNEEDSMEIVV